MAEPMYFQWQNKFLLETIYPRRNRKLADFLIYCREIELWQEFGGRSLSDAEKDAYRRERDAAVMTAYKTYKTEYDYFKMGDVRTTYRSKYRLTDADEPILAPLKELHSVFQKNLTDRQTVRREKVLVAYYLTFWQQKIRTLEDEVKRLERRIAIMHPDHRDRSATAQQLERLRDTTLPIMKDELERLLKFLSNFNQVEKRKAEYHSQRELAEREIRSTEAQLRAVRAPRAGLEARAARLSADLTRLRTPPQAETYEPYFFKDDIDEDLRREFPGAEPSLVSMISGIHKRLASELKALRDPEVRRARMGDYIHELQARLSELQKEASRLEAELSAAPAGSGTVGSRKGRLDMLRSGGLKAVETELEKLSNYRAAIEFAKKTPADLARPIQDAERELQRVREQLSTLAKQAAPLEEAFKAKQSILQTTEMEFLVSFTGDQPITTADVVRGKVDAYKASIEQKLDSDQVEKVQQELLEEIVRRFLAKPTEYPLWLQYMVIHFSGMRYATAHGSWADPKDLLKSLRTSAWQQRFRSLSKNPSAVEEMCEERLAAYESPDPARAPRLALASDERWKTKIATYLRELRLPHRRAHALFELLLDEESYEIDSMDPGEALKVLEGMRDENTIPDWMWTEIVRLTDLRVQEAKDPGWNKLTPEQQDQKNEARYAELREIMNKWKEKHLTGWREEHDRSNRLIVTSSVCNEVAEQIQHLRGYSPSGGLTGIVDWYKKKVDEARAAGNLQSFFVFAKEGAQDAYKEGATILWLRFVHEAPNAWRIAKPMEIGGDRLIPDKYRSRAGHAGEWNYFEGSSITRKRTRSTEKGSRSEEQWLRWMHAATVAKVADTAEGRVVLTFETALPYDDPSVSAVGVFKHDLQNLMWDGGEDYYNGSFVAYLPEGEKPVADLEEMLDWNKILRRPVLTAPQLEEYRRKFIRK